MLRAARLDIDLYEEADATPAAQGEALLIVLLSSIAAGIGTLATGGVPGLIIGTIGALFGWYIWAYLTYLIGTRVLPEPQTEADLGQLLRTTGFASAPGMIRVLGIVPLLQRLVFAVAAVWMLVAMIVAVRQALDYTTTWRAVAVCAIGWLIQALILIALFELAGGPVT